MNEDLSNLFEKLSINKDSISPDMATNLMNILNGYNSSDKNNSDNNSKNTNTENTTNPLNGIDFETIMKMKSIIDKMNIKDDPRSNLLLSLKPYLKESRKEKLDQYMQLLSISRVLDVFPFLGGDKSNANKQ